MQAALISSLADMHNRFRKQQFSGETAEEEVINVAEYGSGQNAGVTPISRAGELSKKNYARRKVRARKVSTFSGIALVIVFLVAVVAFLWDYWIEDLFVESERIIVASFVGEQAEEVTESETFKGLYRFAVVYIQNSDYAEGTIISQDPEGGRSIVPGGGLSPNPMDW